MNTYNLSLSSNSPSYIQTVNELEFDDYTKLTIDLSSIDETFLPMYLKIDWGFGNPILFDNNVYREGNNLINVVKYSPILTDTYSYEYYPSSTALYKSLSAQVLIRYVNGDVSWIVIPIKIRTYGYSESIGDLTLINTNILPVEDNLSEHQLKTSVGGYVIDLRAD